MSLNLPYSTPDFLPLRATIRAEYEDFQVDEIPAYEPSGEGSHVFFGIEKRGLATTRALRDIASELNIKRADIGVAGMKDARGVTRQTLSIEHIDPQKIASLDIPRMKILWVKPHVNKLKTGHLRGNTFVIKLRDTDLSRLDDVKAIMKQLCEKGVPNYYGSQRFGYRGDTWEVGRALLNRSSEKAVKIIAGEPREMDAGEILLARQLFVQGNYQEAARTWPRGFSECSTVCVSMAKSAGDYKKAIASLDKRALGFYVSAYQSWMFNKILAERIERLDVIEDGDIAWKHENGSVFLVEDAAKEQVRARSFEISATGPIFGVRMKMPTGQVQKRELAVLGEEGLELARLPKKGPFRCTGDRRPLRFRPHDVSVNADKDERGDFVSLAFALEAGCYATAVLREICKDGLISEKG